MKSLNTVATTVIVLGAVAALAMAAQLLTRSQRPNEPSGFLITPATTFLTEPLREDGTVDYAAALNAANSRPAASNAAVPLSVVFHYDLPQQTSELMGRDTAVDADLPVFVGENNQQLWDKYQTWRQDRALAPLPEFRAVAGQLAQARLRPWRAAEFPVLHAWLVDMGPALAAIERASHLDGHWIPASDPIDETPTPNLLRIRMAGEALQARAMKRLGEADPAAALLDLRTMLRLSALVSDHASLIGVLIGTAVRQMALEALPQVARHPDLDVDDLAQTQRDLGIDELAADYVVAVNNERLVLLPMITGAAIIGEWGTDPFVEEPFIRNLLAASVEIADTVPWTEIATDYNRHYDLAIEAIRAQTREERLAFEQEAQSVMDGLVAETEGSPLSGLLRVLTLQSSVADQVVLSTINIARANMFRVGRAAAGIRALEELSVLYLDLTIFRQEQGFYPSSIEANGRESTTHRTSYTTAQEPRAVDFALAATLIDAVSSPGRSFCLDATGRFLQANGAETPLAI